MDMVDRGGERGRKHMLKECNKKDINYCTTRYQYAFTSMRDDDFNPRWIVYVDNDDDIKKAIKCAVLCKCAIAIRSGGHQYVGASSTDHRNIQIDMSGKLFEGTDYPYHSYHYDKDTNTARCGVGLA